MYFGLYYDHKIDYLLIKTNYSELTNNINHQDDLITLKNDNNIIGFNIKNISNIFNVKTRIKLFIIRSIASIKNKN